MEAAWFQPSFLTLLIRRMIQNLGPLSHEDSTWLRQWFGFLSDLHFSEAESQVSRLLRSGGVGRAVECDNVGLEAKKGFR